MHSTSTAIPASSCRAIAGSWSIPIDALDVHLCITHDNGLTIFDACPTKAIHEQFTKSDMFLDAVTGAGLPAPRVEGLGDVQAAHLREEVRP